MPVVKTGITTHGESRILPGSIFSAPPEPKERWIVSVEGREKEGKSSWALSAPDPTVVFDFDWRLERVIQKFIKQGKLIEWAGITLPKTKPRRRGEKFEEAELERVKKEATPLWNEILENYDRALEASLTGKVKTIIFDTFTEMADLRLMSEFGRTSNIPPNERGGLNTDLSELVRRGLNYNANVIFVCRVKDEWVNEKPTGGVKRDAWNKLGYIVHTTLSCYLDKANDVTIKVLRNGLDLEKNDEEYTSGDWEDYPPFAYVASQMFGNDPEDWITTPLQRKAILKG